jgi:hypothetical protein
MDQALIELMGASEKPSGSDDESSAVDFKFVNEETGEVEVEAAGKKTRYTLKPLAELYGPGRVVSSIDPKDDHYMPLLLRIEEDIITHDGAALDLSDGLVSLALDRMASNPAAAPGSDALCRRLQLGLRLVLSLNDYSKQEVKLAIRKIAKSVELHTSLGGIRGYLDFIHRMFRR